MKRCAMLIVTDDDSFRRELEQRCRAEKLAPVLGSGTSGDPDADVVVIGPVDDSRLKLILASLASPTRTVLCFVKTSSKTAVRREFEHVRFLKLGDDSADLAVLLAGEIARRVEAAAKLDVHATAAPKSEGDVQMGRSIRDMRHDINNALTSVVGNAELLLLDGDQLTPQAREQAETIRTHALHMHEIMRRMSSVEIEAKAASALAPGRKASRPARG